MTLRHFKHSLVAGVITLVLAPMAHSAETWDDFTRNHDRVTPNPGMLIEDLRYFYGEPAITHSDLAGSSTEVWDYGTFRAFVSDGIVQRAKLW